MAALGSFSRSDRVLFAAGGALVAGAALARYLGAGTVTPFVVAALALAALAVLVGRSVDQLADRLGAGATGVVQSALGNLPELFVGIFALRAGLIRVVQAMIVGSILSNLLLVLGLAFLVGGLRHGRQTFNSGRARMVSLLLLLAVAALLVPSLASYVHTPASRHESALSIVTSVVLLVVFAASVPASLRRTGDEAEPTEPPRWSFGFAVAALLVTSVAAAFVSDWFVHALSPALHQLGISATFAGLVIVAIAGNAVENVVGVQMAARDRPDFALSLILNSPLQIALALAPALVLLSYAVGGTTLTLVFPPLLVTTLAVSVAAVTVIVMDGESVWLEGLALIGLYVVVATSFWWG